ncbi:hypothetical protein EUBHAL_02461 [Anaerobutyricum hallii DSM 3353]|uniref:Uncharacterized protein n=1 Tax=Anaerobutyricum hallii DSM 3353 TaxID=411469 RepID=C0EYF7_9FIRM|nr:hypothetical protein EUBHAL_02461 [Anaerobutyricum hallii DSM 3353]
MNFFISCIILKFRLAKVRTKQVKTLTNIFNISFKELEDIKDRYNET